MILIVDDKPENLFSLKSILQLNNFEVDTAPSGEEALKKILKNSYALIILDVQMPVMDGFEVAETLSGYSKAKDIPIIFLSAVNTDKRFITKGYTSGGIDYITKPVDADILLLKVKTFYRLYEQNQELKEIQNTLRTEIDIRKQAQAQLNTKVKELHSILESMPQIAFTLTADGTVEYANEYWYEFAESLPSFPQVHADDKDIKERWQTAMQNGSSFISEVRIKKLANQQYIYHLLRIIPIKQEDTVVKWVGTFTDIHRQKLMHEILEQKVQERTKELTQSNAALEASNHELQQFASVASHDLKEPLRKIHVFASMMKDKFNRQDYEGASSYISRIIDSAQRMSKLINDLLNYSRLSAAAQYQPADLNSIVNDILSDLELAVIEKKAVFDIGRLPVVDAVPGQMRQVLQNLISNALKFSKENTKPHIKVSATTIAEKDIDSKEDIQGNYCRIVIKDNGIGFNEKYLDKIFTIFQRLNPREAYEGTGIGLAVTKKIIDKHCGLITARSKENEGATFIIILPLHQPQ